MNQYFNENDYPSAWYFLQAGTQIDEYVIERALGGGGVRAGGGALPPV